MSASMNRYFQNKPTTISGLKFYYAFEVLVYG